jgi:uncharacterized repeat protein (TIGR01451 family)
VLTTVDLPVGATATVQLTLGLNPGGTVGGTLRNTVTVENTPGVGGTSTITATDIDQLAPQADLSVTKDLFEFQLNPDTHEIAAVYAIVVRNAGPSTAFGVKLADVPDDQLTFLSNIFDCSTPFPCDLGSIPPGGSRSVTSRFVVPADLKGTPVTNEARVTSDTPDPNPANDSASVTAPAPVAADVAVEVRFQPAAAALGDEVTVFVRAANAGPSSATALNAPATGVVLTDVLPPGLTFLSATPPRARSTPTPASGTWASCRPTAQRLSR